MLFENWLLLVTRALYKLPMNYQSGGSLRWQTSWRVKIMNTRGRMAYWATAILLLQREIMFAWRTWSILEDKWWYGFAEIVFGLGFYNQDSSVSSVKKTERCFFQTSKDSETRPLTAFQKMMEQKLIEYVLQKNRKKILEYTITWYITNSAKQISHTNAI